MSQRGGAVQSHFRLSDKPIASDQIPLGKADIIISVEPMEALRYLPWLSKDATVVTDSKPFVNIPDYPDFNQVENEIKKLKNHILINATQLAQDIKSPKSANIVMLGAASPYLQLKFQSLQDAVKELFKAKGDAVVEANLIALETGRQASQNYSK